MDLGFSRDGLFKKFEKFDDLLCRLTKFISRAFLVLNQDLECGNKNPLRWLNEHSCLFFQTSTIFVLGHTDKDMFNFFETHSREFDGINIIFASQERSILIKDPLKFAGEPNLK